MQGMGNGAKWHTKMWKFMHIHVKMLQNVACYCMSSQEIFHSVCILWDFPYSFSNWQHGVLEQRDFRLKIARVFLYNLLTAQQHKQHLFQCNNVHSVSTALFQFVNQALFVLSNIWPQALLSLPNCTGLRPSYCSTSPPLILSFFASLLWSCFFSYTFWVLRKSILSVFKSR